jgi:hypothetical protein
MPLPPPRQTYRWKIYFDVVVNGEEASLEVGDDDGFSTIAEPASHTAWSWNWADAWTRGDSSTKLSEKVPHRSHYQPPIRFSAALFAADLLTPAPVVRLASTA